MDFSKLYVWSWYWKANTEVESPKVSLWWMMIGSIWVKATFSSIQDSYFISYPRNIAKWPLNTLKRCEPFWWQLPPHSCVRTKRMPPKNTCKCQWQNWITSSGSVCVCWHVWIQCFINRGHTLSMTATWRGKKAQQVLSYSMYGHKIVISLQQLNSYSTCKDCPKKEKDLQTLSVSI